MSTKTLKKLETAGENKKARHKAGLHRWRFFHFPLYFRKKRHSFSKELRRFSPN